MHDHHPHHPGAPLDLPALPHRAGALAHTLRRRRASLLLRAADLGHSPSQPPRPSNSTPPGSPPGNQNSPAQDDVIHSEGGLSGSEHEVEPPEAAEDEPTNPEEPPNTPLADEKRAITVYAARNLTNTIDTKPVGTAWFSA